MFTDKLVINDPDQGRIELAIVSDAMRDTWKTMAADPNTSADDLRVIASKLLEDIDSRRQGLDFLARYVDNLKLRIDALADSTGITTAAFLGETLGSAETLLGELIAQCKAAKTELSSDKTQELEVQVAELMAVVAAREALLANRDKEIAGLQDSLRAQRQSSQTLLSNVGPLLMPIITWANQLGPQAISHNYRFTPQQLTALFGMKTVLDNFQRLSSGPAIAPHPRTMTPEQAEAQFFGTK